MRTLKRIIVHCTATHPDWMEGLPLKDKIDEIRRWHMSPPLNWGDIGYHFLVDRDGTVGEGRPVHKIGAHVRGHNQDSIGIALLGGHGSEADDDPEEHFTDVQLVALRRLILELQEEFGHMEVSGHNRYANKACPGFRAAKWWAEPPKIAVPGASGVGAAVAAATADGWLQWALGAVALVAFGFATYRIWKSKR